MHNTYHAKDNGYGLVTVRDIMNEVVALLNYERHKDGSISVYTDPFSNVVKYKVPAGESLCSYIENAMYAEDGLNY